MASMVEPSWYLCAGFGSGAVSLSSFAPQDPSTNLNGAIVKGIDVLEKQLARSIVPLRFGTLVASPTAPATRTGSIAMSCFESSEK